MIYSHINSNFNTLIEIVLVVATRNLNLYDYLKMKKRSCEKKRFSWQGELVYIAVVIL